MLLRIAWLCILLQSASLLAQKPGTPKRDRVPSTCPVTKPYQTSFFIPALPYKRKPGMGYFWFGTDRLWTSLPVNGIWRGLGHKVFWWRQGYNARIEPEPKLKVTGKRLDSIAPPVVVDRATNAGLSGGDAMLVGFDFPAQGCWEITGRYRS